jgi:drug/metabolite transporter (DMT)-like permease
MEPTGQPSRRRAAALLAGLFCALVWAVNYPAMKVAFRELSPFAYTGGRFLLAAAITVAWGLSRGDPLVPPRGTRWETLLLALSGVGVYQWFYALGVDGTTGFAAALLNAISPLLAAMIVTFVGSERLAPVVWIGSIVSYAGVGLFLKVSSQGDLGTLRGNLLCLGRLPVGRLPVLAGAWALHGRSRPVRRSWAARSPSCSIAGPRWSDRTRRFRDHLIILVFSAVLPLVIAFGLSCDQRPRRRADDPLQLLVPIGAPVGPLDGRASHRQAPRGGVVLAAVTPV